MSFDTSLLSAALTGAVAYGTADFLGGRATLRLSTFAAIAIAQTISAVFIAHVFLQSGQNLPDASVLWPCVVAGCAYLTGLALLYHGLAHGKIGVVAPLCALFSILVPLGGDFHLQRALDGRLLLGIGFCATAAVLIGSSAPLGMKGAASRSVWLGLASGLAYGIADLIMGQVPVADAPSALLGTRLIAASLAVMAFAASSLAGKGILRRRATGLDGLAVAPMAVALPNGTTRSTIAAASSSRALYAGLGLAGMAGVLDMVGQIGYVAAAAQGSMGVAAALVGLFPAVSVLMAVIILHERIGSTQLVGLAVGATGVVLVSV